MSITNDTPLPTDEELTVPQEITLSTPYLKAVAPYMHMACENEIKEFMLKRKELEDPRKTLSEGAAVTACGVKFLQELKKHCLPEVDKYAHCIDMSNAKLFVSDCRESQRYFDRCMEEKMGAERPKMGYFSKLHVHETDRPLPKKYERDYKAEAAKVISELPPDKELRKDYRPFKDWRVTIFDS
uniref:NADH dehydrogenase [ubiquinone] 1 alpha subcomplex subunit 8 n=1 Tax=Syphacia muris TaxID=451379 RepID=A0A0N5AAQ2_9BILA